MNSRIACSRWVIALVLVVTALALFLVSVPSTLAESADYAIDGGWFFTQAGGGQGNGYAVRDAGTDANGQQIKLWTSFQRFGGIDTLGYPVGQPYVGADGFTYQPFQRGNLQWRSELNAAVLSNTFEAMQSAGKDAWLDSKGVPLPIVDDGSGGDYAKALATRLGWLANDAINAKFLANPNAAAIRDWNQARAIELYGLPMSQPQQRGPFISQRFQRIAFQLWTETVAGMPAKGTVVGVLGGDLMKEAGLLPSFAMQALGPGGAPRATPTPTPPPAPAFAWRATSVQGWPNCGTTYFRAFTRDASGNGVNGMVLKSWNDAGNEYVAASRNYGGNDGYWDRVVGPGVRAGKWYVAVLDGSGKDASEVVTINFTGSCDPNAGNVQEAEVEFRPS